MVTFIAIYTYMMGLFSEMGIETDEFNSIWLSFEVVQFQNFFQNLNQQGFLNVFLFTHQLNIISISGFMLAFLAIGLMLGRQIPSSSRLYKTAFLFPTFSIGVALIDICSSITVLVIGMDLVEISNRSAYFISATYISRVVILYAVIIWFMVAGGNILLRRRGQKKTQLS
jgi:hypothetical protein